MANQEIKTIDSLPQSRRLKALFFAKSFEKSGAFSANKVKITTSSPKEVKSSTIEIGNKKESFRFWENSETVPEIFFEGGNRSKTKTVFVFSSSLNEEIIQSGSGFSYKNLNNPVFSETPPTNFSPFVFTEENSEIPRTIFSNTRGDQEISITDLQSFNNLGITGKKKTRDPVSAVKYTPGRNPEFAAGRLVNEPAQQFFSLNNVPGRTETYFYTETGHRIRQILEFKTNETAHITYDLGFGAKTKNIFSFAFDSVDAIIYPQPIFQESQDFSEYFYNPRNGRAPRFRQEKFDYTDQYFVFCQFNKPCDSEDKKEKPPRRICWTGKSVISSEYADWVSGVVESWYKGEAVSKEFPTDLFNFAEAESAKGFNLSGVDVLFTSWRSFVQFNDMVSGDRFYFQPYNFTGVGGSRLEFQEAYFNMFGTTPPYSEPNRFELTFKEDFSTPEELITKLNEKFTQTGKVESKRNSISGLFYPNTGNYSGYYKAYNFNQTFEGWIKSPNLTGGDNPWKYIITGSGFAISGTRNNDNKPREGLISNDEPLSPNSNTRGFFYSRQIFIPGQEKYAGFEFTSDRDGGFKLGGRIESIYNTKPEESTVGFRIIKNRSEQIFPSFSWSRIGDYGGHSFNLSKIPADIILNSGDSLAFVFNTGTTHENSLVYFDPKAEYQSGPTSLNSPFSEISLCKDLAGDFSGFSNHWTVYSSGSGGAFKKLTNERSQASGYFARGFYSSGINNNGIFGISKSDSIIDFTPSGEWSVLECRPSFSGNCFIDLSISKSFGYFKSNPSSGDKLKTSDCDVEILLYNNNTLLKSGEIKDLFNIDQVVGTGRYSGFYYIKEQEQLNQNSVLSLRIKKKNTSKFIDYNIDFNVKLQSGTKHFPAQPIWYPYNCPTGLGEEGIFIDTSNVPIAEASFCSGDECLTQYYGTGFNNLSEDEKLTLINANSGRLIKITSNHFNSGGHFMSFTPSPFRSELDQSVFKDRVKYMIPSGITVYGSNAGTVWTPLFSNIEMSGEIDLEPLDEDPLEINPILPEIVDEDDDEEDDENELIFPSGGFQDLFTLKKFIRKPGEKWCPIEADEEELIAFWPTGWPDIFYRGLEDFPHPCSDKDEKEKEKEKAEKEKEKEEEEERREKEGIPSLSFMRLGSGLDYVEPYVVNGLDLDSFNYRYYRVELNNFYHHPSGLDTSVLVSGFHLRNLNFFSVIKGEGPILKAEEECLTNADYIVDVFGNVPVTITGELSVDIVEGMSGNVSLDNAQIIAKISGLESGDWVRFVKESGRLIANSGTGYFSGKIFATGEFKTGLESIFFNGASLDEAGRPNRIYFEREYSILLTEDSGHLSSLPEEYVNSFDYLGNSGSGSVFGAYTSLRDSTIQRESAVGGFLSPSVYVEIPASSGSGYFFGELEGTTRKENLTGFFTTGFQTGGNATGFVDVSFEIDEIVNNIPINYLNDFTHTQNASANVFIGDLINFTRLSINNFDYIFHNDTLAYQAPTYFNSITGLVNNINETQTSSFVEAFLTGTSGVFISSLISGRDGNLIPISSSNQSRIFISGGENFLTGGITDYQQISGTGRAQTIFEDRFPITGYYEGISGSGNLSGTVMSYFGTRSAGSVWSVLSGDLQNRTGMVYDQILAAYTGRFSGESGRLLPDNRYFNLRYNNLFGAANTGNRDVLEIEILDENMDIISGENPFIVRITGGI